MDWTLAGSVIFTGLSVVFAVLIILMAAIAVMGKIVSSAESKKPAVQAPVSAPSAPAASSISDEEVAVITAAVGTYLGNNNFTIHDIKRK